MFNRLSVNGLLKSVIATLAVSVMVVLALGAWNSWARLLAADRVAAVAEASSHLFTALHNLRVERSSTNRDLLGDKQLSGPSAQIVAVRAAEMPALRAAYAVLQIVDFADRQTMITTLIRRPDGWRHCTRRPRRPSPSPRRRAAASPRSSSPKPAG